MLLTENGIQFGKKNCSSYRGCPQIRQHKATVKKTTSQSTEPSNSKQSTELSLVTSTHIHKYVLMLLIRVRWNVLSEKKSRRYRVAKDDAPLNSIEFRWIEFLEVGLLMLDFFLVDTGGYLLQYTFTIYYTWLSLPVARSKLYRWCSGLIISAWGCSDALHYWANAFDMRTTTTTVIDMEESRVPTNPIVDLLTQKHQTRTPTGGAKRLAMFTSVGLVSRRVSHGHAIGWRTQFCATH